MVFTDLPVILAISTMGIFCAASLRTSSIFCCGFDVTVAGAQCGHDRVVHDLSVVLACLFEIFWGDEFLPWASIWSDVIPR